MQAQKNTRRKRKDPQSRDYVCQCGKGYLSYAAAYTHVKNKHDLEKKFLQSLGRPEREKLPRGRPKQKKKLTNSKEIQRLSIVEQAILTLFEQLKKKFDKMIVQGNNKIKVQQKRSHYDKMIHQFSQKTIIRQKSLKDPNLIIFAQQLTKHFQSQVSSRVLLTLVIYESIQKRSVEVEQMIQMVINEISPLVLWKGSQKQVVSIIIETYLRWSEVEESSIQ